MGEAMTELQQKMDDLVQHLVDVELRDRVECVRNVLLKLAHETRGEAATRSLAMHAAGAVEPDITLTRYTARAEALEHAVDQIRQALEEGA
jgi:hypothetical protein